jgi:MoaA/NifB/PqqE/SkfB family radical SAM enzyme
MKHGAEYFRDGVKYVYNRLFQNKLLTSVALLLTLRCNYKCPYCDLHLRGHNNELRTDEWIDIIKRLRKRGTIRFSLSGGEPLLRDDIDIILNVLKQESAITSVVTNGELLSDKAKLLSDTEYLFITIEGDAKTHNRIRGAGSFQKIVDGIHAWNKLNKKFDIITTISKLNQSDLLSTLKLAKEYKSRVYFQPIQHIDRITNNEDILIPEDELKDIIKQIVSWKKERMPVGNSMAYFNFLLKYPYGVENQKCFAGKYWGSILPDGTLVPCCNTIDNKSNWPRINDLLNNDRLKIDDYISCSGCSIANYVEITLLLQLNLSAWSNVIRNKF